MQARWLLFSIPFLLLAVLMPRSKGSESQPAHTAVALEPASRGVSLAAATTSVDEKVSFEVKLKRIVDEIPTGANWSKPKTDADGDVHGFQADEITEGRKLSELRELTLKNENYISIAQQTYAECAEKDGFDKSVRAVCFMRAMEISIKLKNPEMIVGLNVPVDVRELALKLVN